MNNYDLMIIGGGIVGLATALQILKKRPELKLGILEKEAEVGRHQTGHNSGVIHSGIYYKPGSLKARNCIAGVSELLAFCNENQIPYEACGKVIIATQPQEIPLLEELERRGIANGVKGLEKIGPQRLKEIEPHSICLQALYSPHTGIIDFTKVAKAYARLIQKLGGEILLNQQVKHIEMHTNETRLSTQNNEFTTPFFINCAGLFSDRIARKANPLLTTHRIIPFRGEYYDLVPEKRHLVNGLIYPVPDPKFPFLGVHLTKMIGGGVEAGPNAVLALAREGYSKTHLNMRDCIDFLTYKGFWTMARRYWKIGVYEVYRSLIKKAFVKDVQRLMPCIEEKDLITGNTGVRSQMVGADGKMIDDFLIEQRPGMIHVLNAPSPAATASLSIGKHLAERAIEKLV